MDPRETPSEGLGAKVLVAESCLTLCDPMDCSLQAPLSMEFSRQEHWSGLPYVCVNPKLLIYSSPSHSPTSKHKSAFEVCGCQ